ncbi:transmembrane protein 131 homolog [Armigeres subalbatus]|uniref:transmembrane protein 131 homolog n=1 Tax=Armigeres subalbatus TaxID=124917 RepID=UPI002ED6A2CB
MKMASSKRTFRVFGLLVIFLQLEAQVQSEQPQMQQQHQNEQLSFGAQEMFSSSSQDLMDEMFQRGDTVGRGSGLLGTEKTSPELVGNLVFQPSLLDFLERSIGDPHNQVVILINKHKNRSVFLGSISGSTSDFYSSYFKESVIPPEGNTTFNVVFLPRQLGATAGSIEIHTSFGLLHYHVKGDGIECPYRLKPLVGISAPLNATLTPEITLYNPHDTPLQIMEIYSSGGNFQLELPSGAQEGPQALWEIPPHSTRSVIRVRFHGKTPGNHTSYVRIKISGGNDVPTLIEKMLVVPIEIEIKKHTGYYTKEPFLDLTVENAKENITKVSWNLTNSGQRRMIIKSWGAFFDDGAFVYGSKVYITWRPQPMLNFEIDWTKYPEKSLAQGSLSVSYYEPPNPEFYFTIPFNVQLLRGNLKYDTEILKFLISDDGRHADQNTQLHEPRRLVIRNNFNVPLLISNISVPADCSNNFQITHFVPKTLRPEQEETILRISRIVTENFNRSVSSYIRLMTNVTEYELPIYSYTGMLKRILPFSTTTPRPPEEYEMLDLDDKELNFGILPISTIGETLIAFFNANPVEIPILHWKGAITSQGSGAPTITVILRGCGPHTGENLFLCHTILPKHWIVFQVSVQSSTTDSYQGRFSITTDYEEIVTPISFTTAVGKLELNRELLYFDDCFPGKLCSVNLTAHSTFLSKIHVEGIKTDVDGIEFTVDGRQPVIHPNTVTNIGRLLFDPKMICKTDCYSSFDLLSKPFGVKWMATLDNYEQYKKLDSEKLLQQLKLYSEMRNSWKSIKFQLATDPIRKFEFNATVDLVWPKLLTENIHFPTLQIEQEAVKLITINNPSDQILFVHLVLHDVNIHGQDISELPSEILSKCENCSLSEENMFSFFLFDYDDIYVNYVKPKSFLKIAVKFTSKVPGTYSTIFYMRNNLTLIDAVWIQAKAVIPQFKFGNRKPGSPTALQFEITEKHLKSCSKFQELAVDENPIAIQTKRSFTARNYGEVPITISGIRVEDILCEGYGFKVLDCSPFELQPNASKKIEIAFSPDFTLARVTRTLNFDTNINFPVNFTLLGTVPAHGLESCSLSLSRPWFESILRIILIGILSITMVGTLLASFLDANKVIKDHIINLSRDRGPIQPPLDLRQIALQSPTSAEEVTAEKAPVSRSHQNNNAKKKAPPKQSKVSNGGAFNKTWNDFTSKLGRGFSSKVTEPATNKSSPEMDKRAQKNRRSITPPKEETASYVSTPNHPPPSSTKERNKSTIDEDSSSTTTESSETSSSSISSTSTSSLTAASYKIPFTDSKPSKSSTSSNHHQHHALSRSPPSDLKKDSSSIVSIISNQNTLNSGHHQQQQSKSAASPPLQQPTVCSKANVKKTKSLPLGYESGGMALSLGTSIIAPQQQQTKASTGKDSLNGSVSGLRNNGNKNIGSEKSTGKSSSSHGGKYADRSSREHNGKENGPSFSEHGGKNDSSQSKKFGKTPGRERKSNNGNKKGSKTIHKAQALQFGGKPGNNSNANSANFFLTNSNIPSGGNQFSAPPNIWGENRARFSDVVAQSSAAPEKSSTINSASSSGASKMLNFDLLAANMNGFGVGAVTSPLISDQLQGDASKVAATLFGKAKDDIFVPIEKDMGKGVGSELGAIGTTKKSPTATPMCWDPFGNAVQRPIPVSMSNDLTGSDSYFSQAFGDYGNNSDNFHGTRRDIQAKSAFGSLNANGINTTGGMDSVRDTNQMPMSQRDWDANKILWQMLQKHEELNTASLMDWNSLWSAPPVFSQASHLPQQSNPTLSAMHMNSRLTNNWLNTEAPSPMPLRAPPGFSPVKPTPNPSLAVQGQTHPLNSLQPHHQPQQQQQDSMGVANTNASSVPAYDPFRSIWAPASSSSDVWNEKQ